MASSFAAFAVFKAVDRMTAPMLKMKMGVKGMANQVTVASARISRGFRRIGKAVGALGLTFGLMAGVMLAGNVIGIFKDFEQANANLAAVSRATGREMSAMSKNSQRLGATTAFTATEVAGLSTEYAKLGFAPQEIINMSKATLDLAAATGTELAQAAKQTGAVMKAYGLDSRKAGEVADILALSTAKSALDMEFFATAMSKVAPIADKAGFSLSDTSALFASLADSGFDASVAATSTKNILLKAADANSKLSKAMGGPVKNMPDLIAGFNKITDSGADLTQMLQLTDQRSVSAFATFLEGSKNIVQFSKDMADAGGTAEKMAKIQLNTLTGRLTMLNSAYEGFIMTLEDGNGPFAKWLKQTVSIATEVLTLWSGMEKGPAVMSKADHAIRKSAETWIGYLTTGWEVIKWGAAFVLAIKALSAAWAIYTWAISPAVVATWALIGPFVLIGAAIAAFIVLIVQAVRHFDTWGAAILFLTGPLGILINGFMVFRTNWDAIKRSFSTGGMVSGLLHVGKVLLDVILFPLQQILQLMSNIPGLGGLAGSGAAAIGEMRASMGLLNPEAEKATAKVEREEYVTQEYGRLNLNINNNNGSEVELDGSGPMMPARVSTSSWGVPGI